jgi:hypothetical protein
VNKLSFQEESRTIGVMTGELAQPMEDSQAEEGMMNVAMHAEAEREDEEATRAGVAKFEVEAGEAKSKAEAAEREVNLNAVRRFIRIRYSQLGNPYFHE